MKSKIWFLAGAIFGLFAPIILALAQRYGCRIHPSGFLLFRPGLFIAWPFAYFDAFRTMTAGEVVVAALVFLGNALIFGLMSLVLRRAFPALTGLMLLAVWLQLPPSDRKLKQRFADNRASLEELAQMSDRDSHVKRLSQKSIETEGAPFSMPPEELNKYRDLFHKIGMKEGFRRDGNGSVYFFAHTPFGKADPFGSYYGYVHCASAKGQASGFPPCAGLQSSKEGWAYRYQQVDERWRIFEIFEERSLVD